MNGTDPITLLKEFAAERKKRIQPCEIYDSNVSSSAHNASTGWHPQLISGYALTHQVLMTQRRRRVHIAASQEYMCLQVEGSLDVGLLSINKPNRILFVDVPYNVGPSSKSLWPLFIARRGEQPAQSLELLELPSFHCAVSQLIESPEDSVHICKDSILVYFHPASPDSLQQAIDSFCEFVGARTRLSAKSLRSLPDNLTPLIPLITKWAEGDDVWRAEILSRARKSDLEELIATVEPLFSQVEDYLNTHEDDTAFALGSLAEFVAEARIGLSRHAN
jgi:hypothetical protein